MSANELPTIEFLQTKLIPDLRKMLNRGFAYYVFPLLAQSVELLGAFYDREPLESRMARLSERRFKAGLRAFSDDIYCKNQSKFYEQLRSSFAHQMRPGQGFELTCFSSNAKPEHHLTTADSGKRILVAELFLNEFEEAVRKTITKFQRSAPDIDPSKFRVKFLVISKPSPLPPPATSSTSPASSFSTARPSLSGSNFGEFFSTVSP